MIIVTGGAGFIGSNLVKALNDRGRTDLLVVDDLSDGRKFRNLVDCELLDLIDPEELLDRIAFGEELGAVDAVLHQGACSNTLEWDGQFVLRVNYHYSKALFEYCADRNVPFVYASSAAVYGLSSEFREEPACEHPLNMYGYSKLLFDRWVRQRAGQHPNPVVGLRYFNVYGPREQHKDVMASVAYKHYVQLQRGDRVQLFDSSDDHAAGEQCRDFIHVDDVVAVNLWLLDHPTVSGIFNVGTGRAQTFNDVARTVIAHHGRGEIEYVPFPDELRGSYQSFTQADIGALRRAGYDALFLGVEAGVSRYMKWLDEHPTFANVRLQ